MNGSPVNSPRAGGASPCNTMKHGDKPHYSKNSNQATLKLTRESILLWRRALLLRYFKILGNEKNINVKWTDYDSKSKIITVSDEKRPFEGKLPVKDLFKSSVSVSVERKKLFVISLFYTTQTALIQGQMSLDWTKSEYPKINNAVKELLQSKGDNNVKYVDKALENIEFDNQLLFTDLTTTPRQVNTSDNLDDSRSPIVESKQAKESVISELDIENSKSGDNIHVQNDNIDDNENLHVEDNVKFVVQEQKMEIETLKNTIHVIESNQIEKDQLIDKLVSVCTDMTSKLVQVSTQVCGIEKEVKELNLLLKTQQEHTNMNMQTSVDAELAKVNSNTSEIRKFITETERQFVKHF